MVEVFLLTRFGRRERLIGQIYGGLFGGLLPGRFFVGGLGLCALQSHLFKLLFKISNIRLEFLVPFFGALQTFIDNFYLLVLFGVGHHILGAVVVGFIKLLTKLLNFLFALGLRDLCLIALFDAFLSLLLLLSEQAWVYSLGLCLNLLDE